jgi:hypothetical protein
MNKQSLDTKLARTAIAMNNCDEDQPIDLCHIVAVKEARDELARLTRENEELRAKLEAATPLADMMSEAAYRSNPRMSDGYCEPMGGVAPHKLLHMASEIRAAVAKYDASRKNPTHGGPHA